MGTSGGIRRDRRRRWLAFTVVLVTLAAACTGGDASEDEEESATTIPPARTMLRVGTEAWPECLNPITCDSPALRELVLQHVLPVAFEVDAAGEYRRSPLLAEEPGVEAGAGGMTITYHLNPDARWADEQPITSSDLRATWQAIVTTPGADTRGYDLITEVDDENPTVAVVRLSTPYGDWKELFGGGRGWVLKGDALGPSTDLTGRFQDELPFSAGPYQLATWDADVAVLARAEGYWEESRVPHIDQVRLTRVTVDELVEPSAFHVLIPADPDPGSTPDGFAARSLSTTGVLGVWFDQRTPLLQPVAHRRAVAALIDRAAVRAELPQRLTASGEDSGTIDCLGWLPAVGPWCEAGEAEPPEPDPELGRFALGLAGWVPNENGHLVRDGVPFALPVSHDPAVPGAEEVADAVVDALDSAGVITVRYEVSTRIWSQPRGSDPQTGVGIFAFDVGLSPQVDHLYGCSGGLSSSVLSWCAADVVTPTRNLAAAVGREQQLELVGQIGAAAAEHVAWLPVLRQTATSFFHPDAVEVPQETPAVGGPLAGLYRFSVPD